MRRRSTRFLVSAAACLVIIACASTALQSSDGVGRGGGGRGASVCPTDVRGETRRCLSKYTELLDALEKADGRFFPVLDVEVIRSLCSLFDESVKCAQLLNDACQKTEVVTIEEEFSPHLSVNGLCSLNNIYEDYAMNQHCFHRIKTESKLCHQRFQQSTTIDQQRSSSSSLSSSSLSSSSSSSSSSYSQRYHTQQQQRQYCSQVNQLIVCVQNEVLKNQNSCSRTALTLVGSLVRASLTSSIVCSEENATSSSTAGKSSVVVPASDNSRASAAAVHRADGGWLFVVYAAVLYLTSVLSSSSSSVTLSQPPPHRSRRHHHHLK